MEQISENKEYISQQAKPLAEFEQKIFQSKDDADSLLKEIQTSLITSNSVKSILIDFQSYIGSVLNLYGNVKQSLPKSIKKEKLKQLDEFYFNPWLINDKTKSGKEDDFKKLLNDFINYHAAIDEYLSDSNLLNFGKTKINYIELLVPKLNEKDEKNNKSAT